MSLVYLMRHGQTEWNAVRRLQGQADIALSQKGREQVEAQRKLFSDRTHYLVSSDLKRAVESAQLLGFGTVPTDPRLREIDVGAWQGRPVSELIAENGDAYRAWRFGQHTPPDGESWQAFGARVIAALTEHVAVAAQHERSLLMVCHGGVVRVILDQLLGLDAQRFAAASPASVSTLRLDDGASLVTYNQRPMAAFERSATSSAGGLMDPVPSDETF